MSTSSARVGLRTRLIFVGTFGAILFLIGGVAASAQPLDGSEPTITSDRSDYAPGSSVTLTGANWLSSGSVHIVVNDSAGQTWSHVTDVVADDTGHIVDTFSLPNYFVATFDVTATGTSAGGSPATATTSFTDSAADIDQCGNGPLATPQGCDTWDDWQNGNLNPTQAHYNEGQFVPYRYKISGLTTGSAPHTIVISWDTTDNGQHGLDYIGSYNYTETTANPCAGTVLTTAECDPTNASTYSTGSIPVDPRVQAGPDGTVGTGDDITQIPGVVTLFGGQITSVGCPTSITGVTCAVGDGYSLRTGTYTAGTGYSNNTITAVQISFTADISNPVLAIGGHISKRLDWSPEPTAALISGSPYHMRLQGEGNAGGGVDGNGGSQDRSLSAQAVISPATIKIVKNTLGGDDDTFSFTATGTDLPSAFDITTSGGTGSQTFSNILHFGSKTVTETGPSSAWQFVDLDCDVNFAGDGTTATPSSASSSTQTASINLGEGGDVTCTYRNQPAPGTLTLVKDVINDNGGTAVATDWKLSAAGAGGFTDKSLTSQNPTAPATSSATTGPQSVTANVALTLSESSATVTSGYAASDWSCSGGTYNKTNGVETIKVAPGASATCTIINDDKAPSLTLDKTITNNNGGLRTESEWTLTADGGTAGTLSGPGASGHTDVASGTGFKAGTYSLSESGPTDYTAGSWSCVKNGGSAVTGSSITLANGDSAVCSINNDDKPGTIIVQKIVKPVTSTTSFQYQTTGTGYSGFSLSGGQQNSQTLNAGSYTVTEVVPPGWALTGIGGSTDTNTPYDCTVTGSGGSTGVGDPLTAKATINLKNGDTVTCVFENTGKGATRTQGFWATHPYLADLAWNGGSAFGHNWGSGVTGVTGIGDKTICGVPVTIYTNYNGLGLAPTGDSSELMGGFWADVSKTTNAAKRSTKGQGQMQLLQQLLAAELNASAFGAVPNGGSSSFATWENALCSGTTQQIKDAQQGAASFNTAGDSTTFTPGTSADSKFARFLAKKSAWNIFI
jgi:hypothetical protein